MSLGRRLHLDDVISSFPELGPTIPDGGYSWVVLTGIFLIQMTIPSVLPMYGTVLEYLVETRKADFKSWNEKIILTPILFIAFWSLADPWSKTIVTMAKIPRLVGIIGVTLLSTGVIASGYLATGGVGAYLASSSAGAVMGIGASLVIILSDHVLRKYFRRRLRLALTLRNVGTSLGFIIVPGLTYLLLMEADLKVGLLLMTIIFLPTALGTLTFRTPVPQHASPYRLLLSAEEDNELPITISSDVNKTAQRQERYDGLENLGYDEPDERTNSGALFSEGSNIYSYQEPNEEVDLFINPVTGSDGKWKQQLRVLKIFRFWAAVIGWAGMKVSSLFFWMLLSPFSSGTVKSYQSVVLLIVAGVSTLLPNLISYKILNVASHYRRIYFGVASWLGSAVLIGMTYARSYPWFMTCALLGGISTSSLSSCQDLALYDLLGAQVARRAHKGFSTLIGVCILLFCFIHNTLWCLRIAALLQFLGGLYWISSPIFDLLKARRYGFSHTANGASRNQT